MLDPKDSPTVYIVICELYMQFNFGQETRTGGWEFSYSRGTGILICAS